jgi:hypothetical protein
MNARTQQTFEIALPAESSLSDLMADTGALEAMLTQLEKAARSTVIDTSTSKGRDAVRALASKIAKSKVALDKAGLASTETLRAKVTETNTRRTIAKDRLTSLQAEVDWEVADDERQRIEGERLAKEEEEARQLSNTRRSNRIKAEIQAAIGAMIDQSPEAIASAIYAGQIPHVKVTV